MARLLALLGTAVYRRRGAVVLGWALTLGAVALGAFTLGGVTSSAVTIPGQESTRALERITDRFGGPGTDATARVVIDSPDASVLTEGRNAYYVMQAVEALATLPGVVSATNPLDPSRPTVAPDLQTVYSTLTYDVPPGDITDEDRAELLDVVYKNASTPLDIEATGDALQPPPHVGGPAEATGVLVAIVVLVLTYSSLALAGINLLTAGLGVGVGVLGITMATGFVELQSTTPILATMLGLAVGIDYALLIITRYRGELRDGRGVADAVTRSVASAGSAVVTAGVTVVIALVGLAIAGIPFLTQMGVAAAGTVVVAVVMALTLVPAVLAMMGRRVQGRPRRSRSRPMFLVRWIDVVTRHRLVALVLPALVLAVLALPVTDLRTTLIQAVPADSTQERADRMLADAFGEGFNGPLTVLLEGDGAVAEAERLSLGIAALPDVARVVDPVPSPDGGAALLSVVPQSGPTTVETEQLVEAIREYVQDRMSLEVTAAVTGATAVSVDVAASLNAALPLYLLLVVGLAIILLVLVFRSVLIPVVGVLGFLLTVGAALGSAVVVFQWGWLGALVNLDRAAPLISLAPILVIGILFGLAMDYQVFLVSRMHEAHRNGEPPIAAIRNGFHASAPVVVAAALIMFSVFGGFVPAGEPTIKSIAFPLAVGVLIDAFVVRMMIVPAALSLLGEAAWWLPASLRWLPTLDTDGFTLTPDTVPGPAEHDQPATTRSRPPRLAR